MMSPFSTSCQSLQLVLSFHDVFPRLLLFFSHFYFPNETFLHSSLTPKLPVISALSRDSSLTFVL